MKDESAFSQSRLLELAEIYRGGLLDDVLPFWLQNAVDQELGGIMASVDRSGNCIDTDKSVWQQGRFSWLLGQLYNDPRLHNHPQREAWLAVATDTLEFISRYCFDSVDGRMWFHVTREGQPVRKRRYAFSESFAAIAFGELAQATGRGEYYEQAETCFDRFLSHSLDPSGCEPKFTGTRPMQSIGFPMICLVTAQELRDSIDLPAADQAIDRSIETIRNYFYKPEIQCVMETVGPAGEMLDHFDGRTLNPGHAIEGAWFIMQEGQHRDDPELVQMGLNMLDWMWDRGWDAEFGGLLYFVDVRGLPLQEYWHDMKFWWPHNEVLIATLLAYRLTGEAKYAERHEQAHRWAYQHFPDPEQGEWYGYLHRDGRVSTTLKGNLWKGPFHLPRMQHVCWNLLEQMLSDV
ncbi:MAG: AGE family epimerase/isomerase [Planctomycetota bacterium]|nr:AGE family epimerase/isomerase [Planctomycetota bacterium]